MTSYVTKKQTITTIPYTLGYYTLYTLVLYNPYRSHSTIYYYPLLWLILEEVVCGSRGYTINP